MSLYLRSGLWCMWICFGMDILHHNLETIEASCFSSLDFIGESLDKVLVDNSIRSGKKGKNVGDEVMFIVIELVCPVVKIFRKIHLFGCPEWGFGFLVHLQYLMAKSIYIIREMWQPFTLWYWMGKRTKWHFNSLTWRGPLPMDNSE